jgi:hypothetical protein
MTGKNADVAKVAAALERLDLDLRDMETTSSFADLARLLETTLAQALDEPLMHEALETLDGHCFDVLLKTLRPPSRSGPTSSLQH